MEKWDSRKSSLGSYCQSSNMKWSLNQSGPWREFRPDRPGLSIIVTAPDQRRFVEFLTESDWRSIPEIVNNRYEPTTAARIGFHYCWIWSLSDNSDIASKSVLQH